MKGRKKSSKDNIEDKEITDSNAWQQLKLFQKGLNTQNSSDEDQDPVGKEKRKVLVRQEKILGKLEDAIRELRKMCSRHTSPLKMRK